MRKMQPVLGKKSRVVWVPPGARRFNLFIAQVTSADNDKRRGAVTRARAETKPLVRERIIDRLMAMRKVKACKSAAPRLISTHGCLRRKSGKRNGRARTSDQEMKKERWPVGLMMSVRCRIPERFLNPSLVRISIAPSLRRIASASFMKSLVAGVSLVVPAKKSPNSNPSVLS